MLPTLVHCVDCGTPLAIKPAGELACSCGASRLHRHGELYLQDALPSGVEAERKVRDGQAATYLQHAKFPTQIASVQDWLQQVKASRPVAANNGAARLRALDLGCGPGPYTLALQQAGFEVLAIDISAASLAINAASCRDSGSNVPACFVQYDLQRLALQPESFAVVLMADFIQHLEGRVQRERLLQQVAAALVPGGHFYLSCFNLNIRHFLKGDVHGSFANGAIRYERQTLPNMLALLPRSLQVLNTQPLNVSHATLPDRLLACLPGVWLLARMAAISGRKPTTEKLP